jgi:Aspartyl protease
MRRGIAVALVLSSLAATSLAQAPGGSDPQTLYRDHEWFQLRSAITGRSPALLRGAVASAFHDTGTAERVLRGLIRAEPKSDAANEAYDMLCRIYLRSGQYKKLIDTLDRWSAAFAGRPELESMKKDTERFRGLPDQSNGRRRRSVLRHEPDAFSLPAAVNGKPVEYLFDTGAWLSLVTEPEARKLGLIIQDQGGEATGASGMAIKFRTAVAKDVRIGAMQFRDVSFAVIPHEAEVGILGIPLLLAAGTIVWSKDGNVTIGGPTESPSGAVPNLAFDRNRLLVVMSVLGRNIFATLDTGASGSDLNANFAKQFPEHVERHGKKGKTEIEGVGGKRPFDSVTLPELVFTLDNRPVTLRPATITFQEIAAMGGECCVGNAGHDLLTQTPGFSIDFSTMTLRLR